MRKFISTAVKGSFEGSERIDHKLSPFVRNAMNSYLLDKIDQIRNVDSVFMFKKIQQVSLLCSRLGMTDYLMDINVIKPLRKDARKVIEN